MEKNKKKKTQKSSKTHTSVPIINIRSRCALISRCDALRATKRSEPIKANEGVSPGRTELLDFYLFTSAAEMIIKKRRAQKKRNALQEVEDEKKKSCCRGMRWPAGDTGTARKAGRGMRRMFQRARERETEGVQVFCAVAAL